MTFAPHQRSMEPTDKSKTEMTSESPSPAKISIRSHEDDNDDDDVVGSIYRVGVVGNSVYEWETDSLSPPLTPSPSAPTQCVGGQN